MISLDQALQFRSSGGGTEDGPSLYDFAVREALPEILDGLLDEEQFILAYFFGLVDGCARNLGEIADILSACGTPMSHHQVYSIQQQALAKLRTPSIFAAVAALQGDDH